MNQAHTLVSQHIILNWLQFIEKFRIPIIIGIVTITITAVIYIKDNLEMSTSTTDMLSEDLHWRKLDIEYERLFPQFNDNILVVIEAKTPDQASDTAELLYSEFKNDPSFFNDIYYPALLPYFRQSAFLFLNLNELQDLSDRLAMIQPFLSSLIEDQNLRGFFNMLGNVIDAKQNGEKIDIEPFLLEINQALEDENHQTSWQRLMKPDDKVKDTYRDFIVLQTKDNSTSLLPNEDIIEYVRATIESVKLASNTSIQVRLTGGIVLSYEELRSVSEANIQAILVSFVLVGIILSIGLGSIYLVFACLITLLFGLIATTAFATATIGELNLISVAFAVLYIGLGIDFAIHLLLRFREDKLSISNSRHALQMSITHISKSLILCAITTAIAFYSFIPTDYLGVAELGWIAGSGMFISLIFTFTFLPALLTFIKSTPRLDIQNKHINPILEVLINIPYKHTKIILLLTLMIIVGLSFQYDKIDFDTNTLNLQDPENESVQTYRDLLKDSKTSPWNGILLNKNSIDIQSFKTDIESLPLVDEVISLNDFIPKEQEDKLLIIDDINLLLGTLTSSGRNKEINNKERLDTIKIIIGKLDSMSTDIMGEELKSLKKNLYDLSLKLITSTNDEKINRVEQQLLKSFPGRIRTLSDALKAEYVESKNIPAEIHDRWMSENHYKIKISPVENLNDNAAMKRFVKELQAYDSNVIGSPIISIEAGEAVITAFKSAFTYAFIAIAILLILLVNIKTDALIILSSVFAGGVFTFGFMLLFNIPLNFANIIGLPLLLGIGIDSGIHITDRFRQEHGSQKNIFMTSSSRGVFVSSLTTICSIGNLAFSSHQGTASMGLLLSIGLASMMISTMLVLPAFLIWQDSLNPDALNHD
jgi:hopanoid biosynthesis associated RND transporter like protein HpnN